MIYNLVRRIMYILIVDGHFRNGRAFFFLVARRSIRSLLFFFLVAVSSVFRVNDVLCINSVRFEPVYTLERVLR